MKKIITLSILVLALSVATSACAPNNPQANNQGTYEQHHDHDDHDHDDHDHDHDDHDHDHDHDDHKMESSDLELEYFAQYDFTKQNISLKNGHTHVKNLYFVVFEANTPEEAHDLAHQYFSSKDIMQVKQKEEVSLELGKLYNLQMAHTKGEIKLNLPKTGKLFIATSHEPDKDLDFSLIAEKKELDPLFEQNHDDHK